MSAMASPTIGKNIQTLEGLSDLDLQSIMTQTHQDFLERMEVLQNEQDHRTKQKAEKFKAQAATWAPTVDKTWDYKTISFILEEKLKKIKDDKKFSEWAELYHQDVVASEADTAIFDDPEADFVESYASSIDNRLANSPRNKKRKNWVYGRKTERNPLQAKIAKVTRARKRLFYNQEVARDIFKLEPAEYDKNDEEDDQGVDYELWLSKHRFCDCYSCCC